MYKVTVIMPGTKEGKEELKNKYSEILANIVSKRLNTEELKFLINKLEKQ